MVRMRSPVRLWLAAPKTICFGRWFLNLKVKVYIMCKEKYSCCFTGYRPEKFPFPLVRGNKQYDDFENKLFQRVLRLAKEGCRTFYCGMAMGFDLIAAETVLLVRNAYSEPLKVVCVLPFKNQNYNFSPQWKERFQRVLMSADEQICLSDKYFGGCYQKRNIYMVDNSDYVITWFDGQRGGTENTIRYALKKGRQVFNINENPESIGFQEGFIIC